MNGEDRAEANRDLRFSANEYQNALPFFPKDDESYSSKITLHVALCSFINSSWISMSP
jgi:hypothetical protein